MKRLLSLVCVAMLTIIASAQITWNVKAGGGIATMWGGDLDRVKPHVVAKIGVGLEKPFSANFSLMPSLEIAWKGVKNSGTEYEYNYMVDDYFVKDVDLLYVQIPVMAAYRFNLSNNWNLTLKAGPYVAYNVYNHYKFDQSMYGINYNSESASNKMEIKKFDAGLDVGIDFEYHRFVFGAEGEMGFLSLLGGDAKVNNLAFYATIGYKF